MKITAVIFDLNGTILDDEDEYAEAFRSVLKSLGATTTEKFPHIRGIGVKENWPGLLAKYDLKTGKTPDELALATQQAYLSQLNKITAKPNLEQFISDLKESGIAVGLATSNTWDVVETVLKHLRLDKLFDSITTGEEVANKKPEPDIFIKAAEKLGAVAEECLVIEDTPVGIEAAHQAGMKAVGIAADDETAGLLQAADLVIRGYSEVTPEMLAGI